MTMKLPPASDHVYFNDGFKCSSISITTNLNELNGDNGVISSNDSQGSNEFICKFKFNPFSSNKYLLVIITF